MTYGEVKGALACREGTVRVSPDIARFAKPEAGLGRAGATVPYDVLEQSEFSEAREDGGIVVEIVYVVFRVGSLYGPELEEVYDLHAVPEGPVEETSPGVRTIVRPMGHAVVVNFLIGLSPDAGA